MNSFSSEVVGLSTTSICLVTVRLKSLQRYAARCEYNETLPLVVAGNTDQRALPSTRGFAAVYFCQEATTVRPRSLRDPRALRVYITYRACGLARSVIGGRCTHTVHVEGVERAQFLRVIACSHTTVLRRSTNACAICSVFFYRGDFITPTRPLCDDRRMACATCSLFLCFLSLCACVALRPLDALISGGRKSCRASRLGDRNGRERRLRYRRRRRR